MSNPDKLRKKHIFGTRKPVAGGIRRDAGIGDDSLCDYWQYLNNPGRCSRTRKRIITTPSIDYFD